ncbi:MAG: hypothetical protein AAFY33_04765 [Cyanobacteria bacterium J06643_4]
MALASQNSRTAAFFAIGVGVTLAMTALKALAAWLMDVYVYSVPWVGGFLRSIELVELSNLIVFAILGASLGAATLLLPRRWDHRAKLALLAAVSPLVFCGSYMMQQHLWIKRVAAQSNIDYSDARSITNAYLNREVGSGGFFGFFPLSTQLSELPTRRDSLESARSINPTEALTQELSDLDDPRADFAAIVFERVGWLVRFMYIAIAGFTGLIHYFKWHHWADAQRRLDSRLENGGPAVRERAVRPASGKSSPRSPLSGGRSQKSKSMLGRQSSGRQSLGRQSLGRQSSGKSKTDRSNPDRAKPDRSKSGKSSLGRVAREQSRKGQLGQLKDQPSGRSSSQSKGQSNGQANSQPKSQPKSQPNTFSSGQAHMNPDELPDRRPDAGQSSPSPQRPPNASAPNSSAPNSSAPN